MEIDMEAVTVKMYQERLRTLGLYPGAIDGLKGWMTLAAIRAFQRMNGLKVDGRVGTKTIEALWPSLGFNRDAAGSSGNIRETFPTESQVRMHYGERGANQTLIEVPYTMRLAWNKSIAIRRFSIHEKVHDSALRCFNRIHDHYGPTGINSIGANLFGGCLNVRKKRGGDSWSMHSWGIAIDFDPARNQLRMNRDRARLGKSDAEVFLDIWEEEGWVSLGRSRNYDWMHIQAARLN
jgi:hypothetical protein